VRSKLKMPLNNLIQMVMAWYQKMSL